MCVRIFIFCHMPVSTFESESYFVIKQVTRVYSFASPTGGEYYSVASQERRGGKWNTGEQRTHCQVVWRQVRITVKLDVGVVTLCIFRALKLAVFATACPSTWETRCLMFTKLLSRETTTICSSGRELVYRDRLCSKPNSHSGNTVTYHCYIRDRLL